jgi:hypothetical protein
VLEAEVLNDLHAVDLDEAPGLTNLTRQAEHDGTAQYNPEPKEEHSAGMYACRRPSVVG